MSNARKLQTEIDRVMKKVDEGVELFDEIWEKVYSAEQQNQKEKYEMDLKKEIKKLQRLRDQIKTWIGGTEVKDKEPLVEARKLIETKMEQFKICEKETKTKTYSKEGLARAEKLDPAEEAKLNTTTWIGETIEKLQEAVEETDFEIERLSSGKGKKSNKHQIEALNQHIANHRFHISKLEGIIRLVNNDRLDVDPVDSLRDDIDYYIESWQDEEFQQAYDQEFFYDSLGLDELDVVNVDHVTQAVASSKKLQDDNTSSSSKGSRDRKGNKKAAAASVIPLTIGRARTASATAKKEEEKPTPVKVARASSTVSSQSSSNGAPAAKSPTPPTPPVPAAVSAMPAAGTSMAAILKRETEQQEKERLKVLREQQARAQAEQLRQQQAQRQQEVLRQQEALRQQQLQQLQQQEAQQHQAQQQAQQEALKRQQQEALRQQQAQQEVAKQQAAQLQAQQVAAEQTAQKLQAQVSQGNALDMLTSGLGNLGLGTDSRNDPGIALSGVSAGGPSLDVGSSYVSALGDSFASTPNAVDNDRSRQYMPQNPYHTPGSYPSVPSTIFDNPAIFEKLGTDCLFFIFYYMQGTYQQYLAARELKKQSWRFHKKYMTWFQRHEEPKITTDEYEQGTYVYFDYETGWCTRIKTDFRFEYSFLEDSLQ